MSTNSSSSDAANEFFTSRQKPSEIRIGRKKREAFTKVAVGVKPQPKFSRLASACSDRASGSRHHGRAIDPGNSLQEQACAVFWHGEANFQVGVLPSHLG